VPLVPVVGYWSTERSISRAELVALIGGGGGPAAEGPANYSRVVGVSAVDLPPLAKLLGVEPRGVMDMSAAQIKFLVKTSPNLLGIIRADDVTPDVRALAVDGYQLFGAAHSPLGAWPLLVDEPGVASSFMAAREWTIAAGGDVMLDKAVFRQSKVTGQGPGYAWEGGTSVIDRRYCCGWGGKPLVSGHRTGQMGALGSLFREADLAIVNLESPEPDRFRYHASGFTFTGDPKLLVGLQDTGIDLAGLANNHVGNGGTRGVLDTIRHLDQLGIAHAGAGSNSATARQAAWLEAGGLRIAVLAYCLIDPFSYWARPGHPGSAAYSITSIVRDIKAARKAGADLVIVMPHWGNEYTDAVAPMQRSDARKMTAAGADLILGSHSHWVGPFEQVTPGRFAFYSLGDLVFDWTHDERTQEGVVADLTYAGNRLVQIDLHPTLIIAGQPNLLDPAGDGRAVLDPVRRTSEPRLHW
jgi:poly-gamma-glutamate capsule biosynthesis protein CapA/YwtB (metallophosphatase superfamily)